MQNLVVNKNIEVTAVIPVTDASNRIKILGLWLNDTSSDLPFEFLFILDSLDSYESRIFKNFLRNYEHLRYRVLETNAKSPGLSRNLGIENSNTRWICFWDSDDYPNPSAIYEEIQNIGPEVNVIVGKFETLNMENPAQKKEISKDSSTKDVFMMNPGLWRFVFSRGVIGKKRFTKYRMAEDQLFLCSISLADQNIFFSDRIFYAYVRHEYEQLTKSKKALVDLLEVQKLMIQMIPKQDKKNQELTNLALIRITLTGIKSLGVRSKIILILPFISLVLNPRYFKGSLMGFSSLIAKRAFK